MSAFAERLEAVREAIGVAAGKAGRTAREIELLAVSKGHPPESIRELLDAGQAVFGESRVQEARAKIALLPERTRWHFIGHLQKNKVRQALPLFELLHGVDTLSIARDIARIALEIGAHPRLLLEVNVAGEATKYGFSPDALRAGMEELLGMERLQIEGLMTIAPLAPEAEASRKHFVALRTLRAAIETEFRVALPRLSMGMSGDYTVAVEEGATIVRVGTALFGEREKKKAEGFAD